MSIAAGAAFLGQVALDGGALEVGWLHTGLTPPPTQSNSVAQNRLPGSALMPPRWLSANLAYLRDIDYLAERTGGRGGPKAKAKGKAKAAADGAPTS